jgi:hypothetical protein
MNRFTRVGLLGVWLISGTVSGADAEERRSEFPRDR